MSVIDKAFKGAVWLTLYRGMGQIVSWFTTIAIARILLPSDYGLIDMAMIFIGYVILFRGLGLGAAIVQKEEINEKELSSLFWFLLFWGLVLTCVGFLLSYPTVAAFEEKRILRVTQVMAFLFLISSFSIIPLNLIKRNLEFKTLGLIDVSTTIISCIVMYVIAVKGGGVWTFVGGHFVREIVRSFLFYTAAKWRPFLHFNFNEIKSYVKYGLNIAGSESFRYFYFKSPKFFGGKLLGADLLGFYSLAGNLASIPTERIMNIIRHVTFPVFSRLQNKPDEFNDFYLRLVNFITLLILPIFIGGIFLADSLIPLILGEKWNLAIIPFQLLCVGQLFQTLGVPDEMVNNAQGRPQWTLKINFVFFLLLPISFYFASHYGLNALALPWVFIYPVIKLIFTFFTIKKIGVTLKRYLKSIFHPVMATLIMVFILYVFKNYSSFLLKDFTLNIKLYTIISILLGGGFYFIYVMLFQKNFIMYFVRLKKSKNQSLK